MKKTVMAVTAMACAIGIAGCSETARPVPDATQPSNAAAPTSTQGPIQKKVGQRAGLNCKSTQGEKCSMNFTLTEIKPVDCSANTTLDPNLRVLRVSIDAELDAPVPGVSYPGAFLVSDSWRVRTKDGYITKVKSVWCGEDLSGGPFTDAIQVGDKAKGSANFAVPQDATTLVLRDELFSGWEWTIA